MTDWKSYGEQKKREKQNRNKRRLSGLRLRSRIKDRLKGVHGQTRKIVVQNTQYYERERFLRVMGFGSYKSYLNSALWKNIRKATLERDGFSCRFCGTRATQVHHLDYSLQALRGDSLDSLVSTCRNCHVDVEFDGSKKLTAAKTYRKTQRKLKPAKGQKD